MLLMAHSIPPTPWVEHLARALPVARAGADIEGVHQLRVAAARLDTWLRMGARRILRDDLRRLRRGASAVRDLDVLLQRELPTAFRAWLVELQAESRTALQGLLDEPRTGALIEALDLQPPLVRSRARPFLAAERARLLRRGRAALRGAATLDDVHALRRCLRRWRYAREWLGRPTDAIKALLDEFGAMHDAAVALEHLVRFPGLEHLGAERLALQAEVAERLGLAQRAWRKAKLEGLGSRR